MSHLETLPPWAAIIIAFFLILGSTLTLLGNIGLCRFRSFYERLHAPTLGTSWGTCAIMLASMLMFSLLNNRPVLHELMIGVFMMVTAPVTLMLLGRAALRRDRDRGLIIDKNALDPHAAKGDSKEIEPIKPEATSPENYNPGNGHDSLYPR